MTDEKLIALARETPPEEFSLEQIETMHRRLPHSTELQAALAGQLRLEHALGAALGDPHVSLEWIFTRAASGTAAAGGAARLFGWGPATAMIVAVTSVGVLLHRHWGPADARPVRQVAAAVEAQALRLPPLDEPLMEPNPNEPEAAESAAKSGENEIASPSDQTDRFAPDESRGTAVRRAQQAIEPVKTALRKLLAARPLGAMGQPLAEQSGLFQEVSWQGFEQIERQLEAVEGGHERRTEDGAQRPALMLGGLSQWRGPWPDGAALRVSLADAKPFRMHFWHGTQGITLARYELPRPAWAAYRATRRANDCRPQTLALLATDSDRYRRCGQGAFDLRLQDGQLVLGRGDVPLLVVPCRAKPDEVFLEGPVALGGFELRPCEPLPLDVTPATNSLPASIPAKLTWTRQLPLGAQWNQLAEGRCELLAEDTSELSWSAAAIPDPGLHELVFELEDPMPGTGVYLGDDAGRPLYRLGFYCDETTGRTCFGFATQGDVGADAWHNPSQGPAPYAAVRPWLRLTLGGGWLKCWTSADGEHWSQALEPLGHLPRGFSTAGLYALPGGGTRCLRVRRFEARKLTGLAGLAAPALRAQVSGLIDAPSLAAWRQTVLDSRPPGVDADEWRRACAVELLAVGSGGKISSDVLLDLLEATLPNGNLSVAERIALLDEAALIFDASAPAPLEAFLGCYERLGRAQLRQGYRRPYSMLRHSLMTAPLWTTLPIDPYPASLIGAELAELTAADDREALDRLCDQLEFDCGLRRARSQPPAASDHEEIRRMIAAARAGAEGADSPQVSAAP